LKGFHKFLIFNIKTGETSNESNIKLITEEDPGEAQVYTKKYERIGEYLTLM
jgi:hypothetical protein|tara:strand:- start:274 stop:429 length:156 start_codon:yes stop_codon:yes gene_type:complete